MYQLYKQYITEPNQIIKSSYCDLLFLIKDYLVYEDSVRFELYINNLLQSKYDELTFSTDSTIIISYYLDMILNNQHQYVINNQTLRIYLIISFNKIINIMSDTELILIKELFLKYGCSNQKYFISDKQHLLLNICNLPYYGKLELLGLYYQYLDKRPLEIEDSQTTKKRKINNYDNSINKLPLRKKSWEFHCGLKKGETFCQICNYNKIHQRNFYNSYKIENGDKSPENIILSCHECIEQPSKGNDFKTKVWKKCLGGLKIGQTKCFCCNDSEITLISAVDGHILADKCGGKKTLQNILPICVDCNSSMGKMHMFKFMKESQFSFDRIPKFYHKFFPEYFFI